MERVDLPKSVHNVPTHEEFFGLDENILEDEEFEQEEEKADDDNIKKMLAIMLSLLQEFYIYHMYDSEYYYASEQFNEDIEQFNNELKDNLLVLFNEYVETLATDLDIEWQLPTGTIAVDVEMEELVNTGIDVVTNTLYYDLIDKATYYKELSKTTGTFLPHSNFRRALRRLSNQITYKADYIQKRVNRAYQEFVYGQEALFYWVCSGINTCAWCYEIEAMGAMPLSWFPIDHINGRCELRPVFPDQYSDEYIRARR